MMTDGTVNNGIITVIDTDWLTFGVHAARVSAGQTVGRVAELLQRIGYALNPKPVIIKNKKNQKSK